MIRKITTAAELETIPVGSIVSTVYGRAVLSQTDILNSQSHMEDCGFSLTVLADPSSYEDAPLITSLDELDPALDDSTFLVLYEEDTMEPDNVVRASILRHYRNSRFTARRISFPEGS